MIRLDDIKVQLPHERLRALALIEDLQREVARVCRDRAFLLDLVERATPLLLTYLNRGAGKDGPAAEQWLTDAGYGEGEG